MVVKATQHQATAFPVARCEDGLPGTGRFANPDPRISHTLLPTLHHPYKQAERRGNSMKVLGVAVYVAPSIAML